MHRRIVAASIAALVQLAAAGEGDSLREEVDRLGRQVEALSAAQHVRLDREIESYLDDQSAGQAAQGEKGLDGVTITGRLTAISQSTVGLDPANRSIIAGDFDLDFRFRVTEDLDAFVYLTGSATQFWTNDTIARDADYDADVAPNFPYQFPINGQVTLGGRFDGIGIDGTVPIRRGLIAVREAGVAWEAPVGPNTLTTEIGALDPRVRFGQTAFADDENTQFIHNNFDDSPAFSWLTDATGRVVWGLHQWISFGDNRQYTLNWGYFNTPGRWWDRGQFLAQFSWKGEVVEREMNLRILMLYDRFFPTLLGTTDDDDFQWSVTWDWLVSDSVGLFARLSSNSRDVNPVELDFSLGLQVSGIGTSRPDDVAAFAFGYLKANKSVLVGVPEETEWSFELYYKLMLEGGKLQVTPHLLFVIDPGGGINWVDDTLVILGLRVFVPF
jgi:hypothetical protein